MDLDNRTPDGRNGNANLIAGTFIGICLAMGVIVWAGGLGFSHDQVASNDPAPQVPERSTTGSAY